MLICSSAFEVLSVLTCCMGPRKDEQRRGRLPVKAAGNSPFGSLLDTAFILVLNTDIWSQVSQTSERHSCNCKEVMAAGALMDNLMSGPGRETPKALISLLGHHPPPAHNPMSPTGLNFHSFEQHCWRVHLQTCCSWAQGRHGYHWSGLWTGRSGLDPSLQACLKTSGLCLTLSLTPVLTHRVAFWPAYYLRVVR